MKCIALCCSVLDCNVCMCAPVHECFSMSVSCLVAFAETRLKHREVWARSHGALIQDLRWLDRSEQQAPCLRHVTPLASNHATGTADRPITGVPVPNHTDSRMRLLESALGEASEKIVQLEVEKMRLLAEVEGCS